MIRPIRSVAALGLFTPLAFSSALQASPQQPDDPEARVDELMAVYTDGPGGVVAVVEGGAVVFAKAYGLANLEHRVPMTRESVLDVGSVAKQFTAFAILLLAQRGELSLDDDIRTHLPEVPDFGSVITIRHLVHHMSGLREIYNSSALAGYQSGDGISQEDALRLTSRMRELNFEPGTRYLYSNTGYMLLADIVAETSGMSFPDFMAENVFGPLDMSHTTIMATRGQLIVGAAESYGRDGEDGFRRIFDNSGIQGAGGIYTTADDLALWMSNYGTVALGGQSAGEQRRQRGVLASGDTLSYAFGITLAEWRGLDVIAHGGSSAGYRASFTYFPELDTGVITMSNFAGFDGSIAMQVAEAFLGEHMDAAPLATAAEAPSEAEVDEQEPWMPRADHLASLTGRYYSPELEAVYTLVVEDGRLIVKHRRHPDFELEPREEDVYTGASFFGTARFERNADGEPTGMRVSNGRVLNLLFEKLGG
jgi:CubicO group peptidase (beta-lactamase class C family)